MVRVTQFWYCACWNHYHTLRIYYNEDTLKLGQDPPCLPPDVYMLQPAAAGPHLLEEHPERAAPPPLLAPDVGGPELPAHAAAPQPAQRIRGLELGPTRFNCRVTS